MLDSFINITAEEYCDSVRDGTHDSPKFHDEGYPLITSKAIKEGSLLFDNAGLVSEADFNEINRRSRVDKWDILFTMIGTLGEVYLETSEDINYAIKNVGLFKCGDETKAKWLYYWFRTPENKNAILQLRRGASQQYLPLGTLRSLNITYPTDWAVGKRVIEVLSNYDALIENNRRRIQLLEESARLLYREWFVQLRFPGHEHVKIIDGVPEGWQRSELGDFVDFWNGKKCTKSENGVFPIYGANGIIGMSNEAKYENGVIVGRVGAYCGAVEYCFDKFWGSDNTIIAKCKSEKYVSYLYLMLHFFNLNSFAGGAAQPLLTQSTLTRLSFVQPPIRLIEIFDSIVVDTFRGIDCLIRKNKKLEEARDILLPRLMNGTLTV